MTIPEAIEALTKYVTAFPPEERGGALIRLIDSWEEVHLRHNIPMPVILHLVRHDIGLERHLRRGGFRAYTCRTACMIWHAHIPLREEVEEPGQHLAIVMDRVRRGGSLAKVLGARSCIDGLQKINAFLLPLVERVPDDEVARTEAIRQFLLNHLASEFALGIERGIPRRRQSGRLWQLGTLQRTVPMHPKNRPNRKAR